MKKIARAASSDRSADVALQHAEQFRGDLLPVVERPLQDLVGQIVTGAPEGLDRGLKVHGDPPSLRKRGGAAGRDWSRRARQRGTRGAAASADQAAVAMVARAAFQFQASSSSSRLTGVRPEMIRSSTSARYV